jgi:hypothetical protein
MPTKTGNKTEIRWRIVRITSTPANLDAFCTAGLIQSAHVSLRELDRSAGAQHRQQHDYAIGAAHAVEQTELTEQGIGGDLDAITALEFASPGQHLGAGRRCIDRRLARRANDLREKPCREMASFCHQMKNVPSE